MNKEDQIPEAFILKCIDWGNAIEDLTNSIQELEQYLRSNEFYKSVRETKRKQRIKQTSIKK